MLKKDESNKLEWVENADEQFWLPVTAKDKDGKIEYNGHVRCQMDIMPKDYAEKNKVGSARDEPNISPFLPPPVGRLSFSLNPFKMFEQLVGPAMRRKIYFWCCVVLCSGLCVTLVVFLFPIVIGNVISSAL